MLETYCLYVNREIGACRTMTTTATATAMEALIGDYVAAWEARDADRIAPYHAEDGIFHLHSAAEPVRGREAIRQTFAGLLAVFPDLTFVEEELIFGDWGWVVRWKMSGTLAQPYPAGSKVAEPGSRFEIDALDMITVENGELTAKHTYVDWQAALDQLGLS
jgi:ketosteroid isomerase-like protein